MISSNFKKSLLSELEKQLHFYTDKSSVCIVWQRQTKWLLVYGSRKMQFKGNQTTRKQKYNIITMIYKYHKTSFLYLKNFLLLDIYFSVENFSKWNLINNVGVNEKLSCMELEVASYVKVILVYIHIMQGISMSNKRESILMPSAQRLIPYLNHYLMLPNCVSFVLFTCLLCTILLPFSQTQLIRA